MNRAAASITAASAARRSACSASSPQASIWKLSSSCEAAKASPVSRRLSINAKATTNVRARGRLPLWHDPDSIQRR